MSAYLMFYLGLGLSLLTCCLVFVLLISRMRINRAHENRHKFSFFMPSILTLLLLLLCIFELRPRILDAVAIQENSLYTYNLDSAEALLDRNKLIVGEQVFMISPGTADFDGISLYRLRYAPHTRTVLEIEQLAPAEDVQTPVSE
ncbi:MAG: hypothetical protein Q4E09_02370 [Eubacteriales bacterium]|nr:hypothetical protein [Eubacteriales bacterium]